MTARFPRGPTSTMMPEGYTWRPLGMGDVEAVYELEALGEAFADGEAEIALSDVEADWRMPDFDPATMTMGVFRDGALVAYAQVFKDRAEAMVHPDHRGRGIGSALLDFTWGVARGEGRDRVGQTISEHEHDAEALFRAHGYERAHTSWILRIDLADRPPVPALPEGYRFRDYRPGDDDRRVFEVIDTAFEEWRGTGSVSMGFDNWVVSKLGRARPELVVVISYQDRIVGTSIGIDYGPQTEGWVEQVAVEKAHRGRGLGRALLEESVRRFWELGRRQVGVSTDSRTGALALYEHVGMSVRRTYTRWIEGARPGGAEPARCADVEPCEATGRSACQVRAAQNVSRMCLVCGTENVAGLKARFYELENGDLAGIFRPSQEHQGYPGRLHGGVSSAILDETIGRAINMLHPDVWGVTVELTLRYRKPVPLDDDVRAVGRITKDSSRLFEGTGEIVLADGSVAVEASGKYLRLPIERIAGQGFDETPMVRRRARAPGRDGDLTRCCPGLPAAPIGNMKTLSSAPPRHPDGGPHEAQCTQSTIRHNQRSVTRHHHRPGDR